MKIRTVLSKLFLLPYVSIFFTKVTKHLRLLNSNIMFCNKTVNQNWPYSLLGNFADIIYQNKESFMHRTGVFALCNLHCNIITAVLINDLSVN